MEFPGWLPSSGPLSRRRERDDLTGALSTYNDLFGVPPPQARQMEPAALSALSPNTAPAPIPADPTSLAHLVLLAAGIARSVDRYRAPTIVGGPRRAYNALVTLCETFFKVLLLLESSHDELAVLAAVTKTLHDAAVMELCVCSFCGEGNGHRSDSRRKPHTTREHRDAINGRSALVREIHAFSVALKAVVDRVVANEPTAASSAAERPPGP